MSLKTVFRWMGMMILIACPHALGACAGDDANAPGLPESPGLDGGTAGTKCYGANDCPPGYYCNEFGACSPTSSRFDGGGSQDNGLPPEVEQEQDPPASGKEYVYVAIPEQDMVAKIHSKTLQVRSIKVGKDPGALRTINGQDIALVLGKLSATATILRSRPDGGDDLVTLETAKDLNQLTVSPDGKHALAFFDVGRSKGQLSPKQTFQEVTLLKLAPGNEKSVNLSVGFRPTGVQFSSDGSKAFVITEQGISIIDLKTTTKPTIIPTVPVLKDPLKEPKPDEVLVTPDGALALARLSNVKGIRVVDLAAKSLIDIDLGDVPTDLDLTGDGKLAVAVLRQVNQVALLDVPADLIDPTGIETLSTAPYTAGQATLSSDGELAYLFTNATAQEVVLVTNLVSRELSVFPLKKGVRSVLGSPDGKTALILHNKVPGEPKVEDGFETYVDKSYGYSLLNLSEGFDKLLLTPTDPGPVAFAPNSLTAYLLLGDVQKAVRSVEAIQLDSFMVKSVALGSHPVSLGVISATGKVYVAQSHPLGRVTFVDIQTHETKTVTGFELNSHIIEN